MRGSQYSMDMKFSTYSNRLVGSKIAKLQDTGSYYTNKIKNETEYLVSLILLFYSLEKIEHRN